MEFVEIFDQLSTAAASARTPPAEDAPAALPCDQRAARSEHSPMRAKDEDVAAGAFA
jgi:hypothetical protein